MKKVGLIKKLFAISLLTILASSSLANATQAILNVSYDPTRELYREINPIFIDEWK